MITAKEYFRLCKPCIIFFLKWFAPLLTLIFIVLIVIACLVKGVKPFDSLYEALLCYLIIVLYTNFLSIFCLLFRFCISYNAARRMFSLLFNTSANFIKEFDFSLFMRNDQSKSELVAFDILGKYNDRKFIIKEVEVPQGLYSQKYLEINLYNPDINYQMRSYIQNSKKFHKLTLELKKINIGYSFLGFYTKIRRNKWKKISEKELSDMLVKLKNLEKEYNINFTPN